MSNPTRNNEAYDAVIIGGGPAGSTCAAVLAQHGRNVLLLERETFPRFHIGESLMPETYWTFKRIGVLDRLKCSDNVKKFSVQFVTPNGKESSPFYFDDHNPHECSQTWQVVRSEFDQMMLENAAEKGARVWSPAQALEVIWDRPPADRTNGQAAGLPRAEGVRVRGADGSVREIRAQVVVDATGTSALISKTLGIRNPDPQLRKAAVFAHFRGALRDPSPRDEGATIVAHVAEQNGWFWYIPLRNNVVSVGVVADAQYLTHNRKDPLRVLDEEIAKCPWLAPRVAGAERCSPVHVLSDYSYNSTRCAGDGWVLIGDAFAFLDPIYSSGVLLALKSGELAADAIHASLAAGDVSAARLGCWGDDFYAGMQRIRRLVYAFYTKGFSFGQFNREHPDQKDNLIRLLIGDVFNGEVGQIFDDMRRHCPLPEPLTLQSP